MKKLHFVYFAVVIILIASFFIYEALSSQHLSYHFSFVGYGGTFKYHDLKIIGIPIYWFMMLCGFVITFIVSKFKRSQYHLSTAETIVFPIIFLIIAYIGAKLLYIIEDYKTFKNSGFQLSGVSLFGAIYLVLLIVPLIALITKKSVFAMYDFFTPFGIILLACTRMGCFFNGCCGAPIIWKGFRPIILPVQLMEVTCDLLILELCFWVEKKYPFKGLMYPIFMLTYGICRFLLEFLRDTPKDILNLSHGQIFSLIAIALSIVLITIYKYSNKKEN